VTSFTLRKSAKARPSVFLWDDYDRGVPKTRRGFNYVILQHLLHFVIDNLLHDGISWPVSLFYRDIGFNADNVFYFVSEPFNLLKG